MADDSVTLGITALVISVVALLASILQVFQQYLSTATDGYRRCTKRVMGAWSKATHRNFRWTELRFEVTFETPVLWLAPPTNPNGPLGNTKDRKIYNCDGSDTSYAEWNTEQPQVAAKAVHTTDDEVASWVLLLGAIQREERDSREWQKAQLPPPKDGGPKEPVYTICHQMQKKKRSWDFQGPSAKPFATTTLCHLVEMVSLLGMYWKQFDVQRGDVSAEGNGYLFSSSLIRGLGLYTYFSVTGPSVFAANRVIPCNEIKNLAFGFVPCILDRPLEVGNLARVKRTLATLSCDPLTIATWEKKKDRTYMFSTTFELVAMVANPFRIRHSLFRMLPNPTNDTWLGDVTKIDWVAAMTAFQPHLRTYLDSYELPTSPVGPDPHLLDISSQWQTMQQSWQYGVKAQNMPLEMRESIQNGLDISGVYFKTKESHEVAAVISSHFGHVLKATDILETSITTLGANSTHNFVKYYFDEIRPKVEVEGLDQTDAGKRERGAMWTSLMFRMICWSLLHDFDKSDVNIVASNLIGSRMPVFIG